jgi:hypothetical protein
MKDVHIISGKPHNGVLQFNLYLKINNAKSVKCKLMSHTTTKYLYSIGYIFSVCLDNINNPIGILSYPNYQSGDLPVFTAYPAPVTNPNVSIPLSNFNSGPHQIIFYDVDKAIASGLGDNTENSFIAILEFED